MKAEYVIAVLAGVVALIVVSAGIYGWTLLKPWVTIPEQIDVEALDERYAQARGEFQRFLSRKGIENYALHDLLAKAEPILDDVFGDLTTHATDCEDDTSAALQAYVENREKLAPLMKEMDALLEGGLVLGSVDFDPDRPIEENTQDTEYDIPDFSTLRLFFDTMLFDAADALHRGEVDAAMKSVDKTMTLAAGLQDTYFLINIYFGAAAERFVFQLFVETLPQWPNQELHRLEAVVKRQTWNDDIFVRGLISELIWVVEGSDGVVESALEGAPAKDGSLDEKVFAFPLRFLQRHTNTAAKAWTFSAIDATRMGRPWSYKDHYYPELRDHFAEMMVQTFRKYIEKSTVIGQADEAVLAAIEKERLFRSGQGEGQFQITFAEDSEIHVNRDGGCVIWNW